MRRIDKIIIHCSDTPEGRSNTIADIDAWHRERGFFRKYAPKDARYKHVGYHYVIHLDGSIHEGRTEAEVGAHCAGYNQHSIGICYIGGRSKDMKATRDTRTPEQRESLVRLLYELVRKYPNATVHGHNEFAAKDCPCFDVGEEYKIM